MIKILCFFLLVASANCFFVGNSSCSKEKIVRGKLDHIESAPYLAQFLMFGQITCGASIISEYWLVTAAHCIDEGDVSIRTGTSAKSPTKSGWEYQVEKIIKHENFENPNSSSLGNDIALIKLQQPIKFNELQQPIPIATSPAKVGQTARVFGWGRVHLFLRASTLRSVEVPVINRETCRQNYDPLFTVTENMYCAGTGHGDPCKGDSGGPSVIDGKLAGVISFGIGCNNPRYPGVYTEVFNYRSWIANHTGLQI